MAAVVSHPAPGIHHKPAALLLGETDRPHGSGFGRLAAWGFNNPDNLAALADQRDTPAA
jgi:hypothetical protein